MIIDWFQSNHGGAVGEGLALAAGLGAFRVVDSVAHKHQWSETWKNTHSINALLRSQIMRKYLRMDRSARLDFPSGEVITLAASDARRVGRISFIHMAWAVPLGIAGSCVVLCVLLGWSGLFGIAVLVAGLWLANVANDRLYALEPDIRQVNGERMGLVTDYFSALRTLRAHGWEDVAQGGVDRKRAALNALLSRRQRRLATLYLVNAAAPVLMITATLVVYAASGHTLKAGVVFSAIAVLTVMRSQLPELVRYLDMRNEWRVALVRVSKFLEAPDKAESGRDERSRAGHRAGRRLVRLAWGRGRAALSHRRRPADRRPANSSPSSGRVGSGKSALLAALAGSLRAVDGTVEVPRRRDPPSAEALDHAGHRRGEHPLLRAGRRGALRRRPARDRPGHRPGRDGQARRDRRWASAARGSPAASVSASRWPAPPTSRRTSTSSTTPPAPWTTRWPPSSSTSCSPGCWPGAPASWPPTAWTSPAARTGWSCSTPAGSWPRARTPRSPRSRRSC